MKGTKEMSKRFLLNLTTTVCAVVFILFPARNQAQQTLQVLHDHLRPEVASGQAVRVGVVFPTEHMHLAIQLPLRNQADLNNFLERLYDLNSPDFRKYLSVEEFTERYGPTKEDYQAVVDFAKANGLTVLDTPINRMLVEVDGATPQVEKAFHVVMTQYQHPTENRTFYSPDREPSLELNVPVLHISGLDNFSLPHPRQSTVLNPSAPYPPPATGSGPSNSYLGSDMRAIYYGNGPLTGSDQAVGLLEFDGYTMADVNLNFSTIGQTNKVPINNVLLGGLTAPMGTGGNDAEPVLDIITPIGMAPGLSQVRVYECCNSNYSGNPSGVVVILNKMASENIAKQLSSSYGYANEASSDDPIYQEMAAQGQTFFAATGDYGAPQNQTNTTEDDFYPSDDTWVTAVSMSLVFSSGEGGPWASEIYAGGSGGGYSDGPSPVPIPSWQLPVINSSNRGSKLYRNVPDVVMDGYGLYLCGMSQCNPGNGGSSFASPMWAGYLALVNEQAVSEGKPTIGFLNPILYKIGQSADYSQDFHDIIGGNNDCCGQSTFYTAVTGYDLVGGWGSPNGQSMINDLITPPSTTCTPTTITPFLEVNGAAWQQSASATVTSTSATVNLGPQPISGGSWNWTGPNGFTSTLREIDGIPLIAGGNSFVATYTNASGCNSSVTFTITAPASATPIVPFIQLNGGAWQQAATAVVTSTSAIVNLGPEAGTGGSWNWTGSSGFKSTLREIDNIKLKKGTDTYVVTYTNASGVASMQTFTITVK
jgi:subtilase family serine protease